MHDYLTSGYGKMGHGLLRYSEAEIVAVIDRSKAGQSVRALTGIPTDAPIVASVAEAANLGADTLILGVATPGGVFPADWWDEMETALKAGMSLVNGLHAPLALNPRLTAALQPGRTIWDVRTEPANLKNGTGAARQLAAKRVLTVGTDMAIGKMTACIELDRAARMRGVRSKFLASGQIGICIAGDGVALDAVRCDPVLLHVVRVDDARFCGRSGEFAAHAGGGLHVVDLPAAQGQRRAARYCRSVNPPS